MKKKQTSRLVKSTLSLLLTAAIAFSPCTTAVFAAESQAQPAETAVTSGSTLND